MLLRRPQTPTSWKHPNPQFPDASPSPLSPKRWLGRDSGAVGLGIVAALDNSIISSVSLAKAILTTAPVAIPSPRPAKCIDESGSRQPTNDMGGLFCRSPAASCNKEIMVPEFLSHCCMCRKRLHGKDIYMYMEKAFCSMECRYERIVSDEVQEKCGRSKMSSSPCTGGVPAYPA